jgi:dTDP-glucose pyrophosphorylase
MQRLKAFADLLSAPDAKLGDIMRRFNELPHPFVIVVDGTGRPIGTVTDGDIRRAILAGNGLETPISTVMNSRPHIGTVADPAAARTLLEQVAFLPMVDPAGALAEIWRASPAATRISAALVMAGGYGKRLGKKTKSAPKPLLPVGDKPILEHILARLEQNGIPDIFVSTHYLADRIREYLDSRNGRARPSIIHEEASLGTAGALTLLPEPIEGPILVVNGDVLTQLDIEALDAFHHAHGFDGTIAVSPHRIDVPYGVIRQKSDGGFDGIDEKPTFTYFVAAGVYLLAPEFCRLVPEATRIDMPDLLNLGRSAGLKIGLFPVHEYWIDVGRPDDLAAADRHHRDQR